MRECLCRCATPSVLWLASQHAAALAPLTCNCLHGSALELEPQRRQLLSQRGRRAAKDYARAEL